MKNSLRIDHVEKTIIMDRTFAKNAENTRSEEYRHLQAVRQDYPEYGVVRKQIKKAEHKECYKGLNYEYMRTYIANHEPMATRQAVSDELEHMIEISKCHSIRYPTIKKWFLAKYPEVAKFGVLKVEEKAQTEEAKSDNVIPMAETQAADNAA